MALLTHEGLRDPMASLQMPSSPARGRPLVLSLPSARGPEVMLCHSIPLEGSPGLGLGTLDHWGGGLSESRVGGTGGCIFSLQQRLPEAEGCACPSDGRPIGVLPWPSSESLAHGSVHGGFQSGRHGAQMQFLLTPKAFFPGSPFTTWIL